MTGWLESLTFEDFDHRETIVRRLANAGPDGAAALVAHAQNDDSPLRLRARYMLRRTFWELAPKVLKQAESLDLALRVKGEETFLAMADLYPLDQHHHGGWQKRALLYEQFGRHERALAAYEQWVPRGTGCANCDAAIAAEKRVSLLRCHLKLKQTDKAEALCWSEIRKAEDMVSSPRPEFSVALVDIWESRDQLDQLEAKLKRPGSGNRRAVDTALEYIAIRRDFRAGHYGGLLTHFRDYIFPGHFYYEWERPDRWKGRVAAEALGRLGEQAVPILAGHLLERGIPDPWTVYALRLTKSEGAIEPIVHVTLHSGFGVPTLVLETLKEHRGTATDGLVRQLRSEDRSICHGAARLLGQVGTERAIEPLIEHLGELEWSCAYALWRLTGETLGLEELDQSEWANEGKKRWHAWWTEHKSDFRVKTPEWWRTPEAASLLLEALSSRSWQRPFGPLRDLIALEHPALARMLEEPQGLLSEFEERRLSHVRLAVARAWLRFDPAPCIPAMIEHTNLIDLRSELSRLTRQRFGGDRPAWRAWWEANKDEVELPVEERWW